MKVGNKDFSIVSGPNADRLIDAFKNAHKKKAASPITFRVIGKTEPHPNNPVTMIDIIDVTISSISHEDDSGHKFILVGHCKAPLGKKHQLPNNSCVGPINSAELVQVQFKASYDSKTKEGNITII